MSLSRISSLLVSSGFALALIHVAIDAAAASGSDSNAPAEAQRLFDEALTLLDRDQAELACPKLEQSNQLDPGVGTQFQLADCYERIGKLATAHRLFGDVASRCAVLGAHEHERLAIVRKTKLEALLQYLEVHLEVPREGLQVIIDGAPMAKDVWSKPFPIDSGVHLFEVSLPGYETLRGTVTVPAGQRVTRLPIDRLQPKATGAQHARVTEPFGKVALSHPGNRFGTYRTIGYVATGVGTVGLALGGVYGLIAISKRGKSEPYCYEQDGRQQCRTDAATALHNEAVNAGSWSTAFFVTGGAITAVGVALLFALPNHRQTSVGRTPVGIGFGIAPHGGFARLGGEF